jgi:predicted O-methyltransferase YrrM
VLNAADGSVDLLFLDADRSAYVGCWPRLRRVLNPAAA